MRDSLKVSLIIFDMFHLLDSNNDGKLWRFSINPSIELEEPDISKSFLKNLKIWNISEKIIEFFETKFITDIDFDEFRRMILSEAPKL